MLNLTPNGLSIEQLKKDAKAIKKQLEIPLSEALDIVASKKTKYNQWHKLMKVCNDEGGAISAYDFYGKNLSKQKLVTFKNKPLNVIHAPPGTGKTVLVHQFLINYYDVDKSNKKILFSDVCDYGSTGHKAFMENLYGDRIHYEYQESYFGADITKYTTEDSNSYIEKLTNILNEDYSLVILDEIQRFEHLTDYETYRNFFTKCSEFNITVIVASQCMHSELLRFFKDHISNIIYTDFFHSNKSIIEVFDLDNKRFDFNLDKTGISGVGFLNLIDGELKEVSFTPKVKMSNMDFFDII